MGFMKLNSLQNISCLSVNLFLVLLLGIKNLVCSQKQEFDLKDSYS